jgi:O-antigen/teichoic acid export membrane protein
LLKNPQRHWFISYLRDPLRNNAVLLIASSAVSMLIGFFFWKLAAQIFSVEDVGRTTAMVSAANLLMILSGFGMGMGIIRFIPKEQNKTRLINTAATVVVSASLISSIIFLLGIDFWSPALSFMHGNFLLISAFIVLCVFQTVVSFQISVFAAFRAAQYSFYQSLSTAVKIIIVIIPLGMGVAGIFISFTMGFIVAFILASYFVRKLDTGYRLMPSFDKGVLTNIFRFSFGNFIGDVLRSFTAVIMPLIVINLLGAAQSAYFYISWMIAALFFTVPYSVNISLVAETSHNPNEIYRHVFKALKFALFILAPAIVMIYFLGGFFLSFFGQQYAHEGIWLLRILAISSIPVTVNETYVAIFRIRKSMIPVILIYGLIALFTIAGSYLLLGEMGLNGIGVAWLGAHVITMIIMITLSLLKMVNHGTASEVNTPTNRVI